MKNKHRGFAFYWSSRAQSRDLRSFGFAQDDKGGFTLIELSIVLVIIGLIVGGVLMGRDLIQAATIRGAVSQIEEYNRAANTFRLKYNYLPGDIPDPDASSVGLTSRGSYAGQGNGDGLLLGSSPASSYSVGTMQTGETQVFWRDLSESAMIGNTFNTALSDTLHSGLIDFTTTPSLYDYYPVSKLGDKMLIIAWSGAKCTGNCWIQDGINKFSIAEGVHLVNGQPYAGMLPTLPVNIVANFDTKMDDGMPLTGRVKAQYVRYSVAPIWAQVDRVDEPEDATPASSSTCFDNNNVGSATPEYTLDVNGGNGRNCALTINFQ